MLPILIYLTMSDEKKISNSSYSILEVAQYIFGHITTYIVSLVIDYLVNHNIYLGRHYIFKANGCVNLPCRLDTEVGEGEY